MAVNDSYVARVIALENIYCQEAVTFLQPVGLQRRPYFRFRPRQSPAGGRFRPSTSRNCSALSR